MPVTNPPADVVSGQHADPRRLAATIAAACDNSSLAHYLVPDPQERAAILAAAFTITIERAQRSGTVCTVEDPSGQPLAVAAWRPHGSGSEPFDPDFRLAESTGRYCPRFFALGAALHGALPTGRPYQYLEILAVHPGHRGQGLGTRLLAQYLDYLDATGQYAALVADGGALGFCSGFAFATYTDPVAVPDTTTLVYPMLRRPRQRRRA